MLNAKVAQLVEHDLAKVGVASSNLVFRSNPFQKKGFIVKRFNDRSGGGTGRHAGLKILFPSKECGFDSRPEYKNLASTDVLARFFRLSSYFASINLFVYCAGKELMFIYLFLFSRTIIKIDVCGNFRAIP
jgi:hypothetical protein